MAQDIVGSLFGTTPQSIQSENIDSIYNQANRFAQLDPMQRAQQGIYMGGAMLGQGVAGLLGGEDPRLVQARQMEQVKQWISQSGVDINTPEGLAQAAQYAQSIGATEGAMFLGQQSMALRKGAAEEQYKLAQAQKAMQPDIKDLTRTQIYNGYLQQYGDPVKASMATEQYFSGLRQREAAAGAPQPGNVKPGDIASLAGVIKTNLEPYTKSLDQIQKSKVFVEEAKQGKEGSQAALDQSILQIIGDNQVSKAEMQNLAASGSLPSRVANTISKWVSGTGTLNSIQEKEDLLNALEYRVGSTYNAVRSQQEQLWSTARLPKESVGAAVGKPFVSAWEKEGKTPATTKGKLGGSLVQGANGMLEYRKPQQ